MIVAMLRTPPGSEIQAGGETACDRGCERQSIAGRGHLSTYGTWLRIGGIMVAQPRLRPRPRCRCVFAIADTQRAQSLWPLRSFPQPDRRLGSGGLAAVVLSRVCPKGRDEGAPLTGSGRPPDNLAPDRGEKRTA